MKSVALAVLLSASIPASAQVRLTGNVPEDVSEENVRKVWQFVRELTGIRSKEAPTIRFASFFVPSDDAAWNEREAAWHRRHPQAPDPLPRSSIGWFFEDTDVMQISPVAFTRFPRTGQGYVVVAHELEHYLYDGVLPEESQHCYFESHGHRLTTIDFLIASGIGGDSLRVPRVDNEPLSGCDPK